MRFRFPRSDGCTRGRVCASYAAQCARSNEIVAAASLDDVGRHSDCRSGNANVRWMLSHLVDRRISSASRCSTNPDPPHRKITLCPTEICAHSTCAISRRSTPTSSTAWTSSSTTGPP
ncbi:DUF664 domain-containing protein [Streptomyces sp. NPDC020800]|uniref:mycothiol transferase n=1 Tax=Streptomyces sp. NPDC020800 TaxID=3365092 RepID=UPI0037A5C5D6